jgi:hypothetical protein
MSADGGFQLPVVQAGPASRAPAPAPLRDAGWERAARAAVILSWVSLVYMAVEGGVGLWQGLAAGSVAPTGWGLASFIEGLSCPCLRAGRRLRERWPRTRGGYCPPGLRSTRRQR